MDLSLQINFTSLIFVALSMATIKIMDALYDVDVPTWIKVTVLSVFFISCAGVVGGWLLAIWTDL